MGKNTKDHMERYKQIQLENYEKIKADVDSEDLLMAYVAVRDRLQAVLYTSIAVADVDKEVYEKVDNTKVNPIENYNEIILTKSKLNIIERKILELEVECEKKTYEENYDEDDNLEKISEMMEKENDKQ